MKRPPDPFELIVDNKLPSDKCCAVEDLTDEEFAAFAAQSQEIHDRYPEIVALRERAHANRDTAMMLAATEIVASYIMWSDGLAEHRREKLQVVKEKSDP